MHHYFSDDLFLPAKKKINKKNLENNLMQISDLETLLAALDEKL